jgi:hypothetical protein
MKKEDQPLESDYVSGVYKRKYTRILFTKNGNSNGEINKRINKGKNIKSLHSILLDKILTKKTKKRIIKLW